MTDEDDDDDEDELANASTTNASGTSPTRYWIVDVRKAPRRMFGSGSKSVAGRVNQLHSRTR